MTRQRSDLPLLVREIQAGDLADVSVSAQPGYAGD
jgi:hypothetical protein